MTTTSRRQPTPLGATPPTMLPAVAARSARRRRDCRPLWLGLGVLYVLVLLFPLAQGLAGSDGAGAVDVPPTAKEGGAGVEEGAAAPPAVAGRAGSSGSGGTTGFGLLDSLLGGVKKGKEEAPAAAAVVDEAAVAVATDSPLGMPAAAALEDTRLSVAATGEGGQELPPPPPQQQASTAQAKPKAPQAEVNYAAEKAGAVVLQASEALVGAKNLLDDDKDKYARSPCEQSKWVIINLSEDIRIHALVLANYEKFSSMVKDFQVLYSVKCPSLDEGDEDGWMDLGTFQAREKAGEQRFPVDPPRYARYLKVRLLSHWSREFYCTLSQIKVFGSTLQQGFMDDWQRQKLNLGSQLEAIDPEEGGAAAGESAQTGGEALGAATANQTCVADGTCLAPPEQVDWKDKENKAIPGNALEAPSPSNETAAEAPAAPPVTDKANVHSTMGPATPAQEAMPQEDNTPTPQLSSSSSSSSSSPPSDPATPSSGSRPESVLPASPPADVPLPPAAPVEATRTPPEATLPVSAPSSAPRVQGEGAKEVVVEAPAAKDQPLVPPPDPVATKKEEAKETAPAPGAGDHQQKTTSSSSSAAPQEFKLPGHQPQGTAAGAPGLSVSLPTAEDSPPAVEPSEQDERQRNPDAVGPKEEASGPDNIPRDATTTTTTTTTPTTAVTPTPVVTLEEGVATPVPQTATTSDLGSSSASSSSSSSNAAAATPATSTATVVATVSGAPAKTEIMTRFRHQCLQQMRLGDFKKQKLAKLQEDLRVKGAGGGGATASPLGSGSPYDNIFKTLMDEMTSLEINQSIFDVYVSNLHSCFVQVVDDVLLEQDRARLEAGETMGLVHGRLHAQQLVNEQLLHRLHRLENTFLLGAAAWLVTVAVLAFLACTQFLAWRKQQQQQQRARCREQEQELQQPYAQQPQRQPWPQDKEKLY